MELRRARPGRGSNRHRLAAVLTATAVLCVPALAGAALGACGSRTGDVTSADADAYGVVIGRFLPPSPDAGGDRPVVYIARLGEGRFELDDQVALIDAVAGTHDLRFVDEYGAAVDDGEVGPRDDGLLLGVGSIASSPPHVVRVEVFGRAGEVDAHLLTLVRRGERWAVETSELVEPEVLVGDE